MPKTARSALEKSQWEQIEGVVRAYSTVAITKFQKEYCFEQGGTSQGYVLRKDIRLWLYQRVRMLAERQRMTYAICQELSSEGSDSPGLSHCERFPLPFSKKQPDGKFKAIEDCTANCHVSCQGSTDPPCGQPKITTYNPFQARYLESQPTAQMRLPIYDKGIEFEPL